MLSLLILNDCGFIANKPSLIYTLWFSTKIVNNCVVSSNSKIFHSKFRLSRHTMRNQIVNGFIPGLKKTL